jgi:hypothetical protein
LTRQTPIFLRILGCQVPMLEIARLRRVSGRGTRTVKDLPAKSETPEGARRSVVLDDGIGRVGQSSGIHILGGLTNGDL